nr:arrestin domain-containing protein 3-like isoform X3 [Leptinotarsa decemlineata]XP_023014665.1 arrestin domain-containing protein 3-like isoform X3 [Leptinotarsa decemlineata]
MSCNLILQDFGGTCDPGSSISGYVVCTFQSNKNIRGLKVKVRGKEYTAWNESESYTENGESKTRDVSYSGHNTFLRIDIVLLGESTMVPGRYEYPFTFTLPTNLPSNYEGIYGHVKYSIKATVDLPFAMDYEEIRYFNVNARIDFNQIRSELPLAPISYQDEKIICCCCCASGPITLDVHLQKEAFVLGEVARIRIVVSNLSNENIQGMNVTLIGNFQTIISIVTIPSTKERAESVLLASTSDTGVGAHGERTYDLELQIPTSAVVYNFKQCTLFQQKFILKIEARIGGCHTNMDVKTYVMLGHIPLDDIQNQSIQNTPYSQSEMSTVSLLPPPICTPTNYDPPYSLSDKTSPYPIAAQIGFNLPPGSNGLQPVPVHGAGPYPPASSSSAAVASAPPKESVPSAPSEAEMAKGDESLVLNDPSSKLSDPPPPTYSDAVRAPSSESDSAWVNFH